jgi:hypothetical protein
MPGQAPEIATEFSLPEALLRAVENEEEEGEAIPLCLTA